MFGYLVSICVTGVIRSFRAVFRLFYSRDPANFVNYLRDNRKKMPAKRCCRRQVEGEKGFFSHARIKNSRPWQRNNFKFRQTRRRIKVSMKINLKYSWLRCYLWNVPRFFFFFFSELIQKITQAFVCLVFFSTKIKKKLATHSI